MIPAIEAALATLGALCIAACVLVLGICASVRKADRAAAAEQTRQHMAWLESLRADVDEWNRGAAL